MIIQVVAGAYRLVIFFVLVAPACNRARVFEQPALERSVGGTLGVNVPIASNLRRHLKDQPAEWSAAVTTKAKRVPTLLSQRK
jgi:hypothetical protein